jgi:hypothetical protein
MSKMSDLILDIQDLLEQGFSPQTISDRLGVPHQWVLEIQESMNQNIWQ